MIAYKTNLEKFPENCKDCPCHWCRIPCKKNTVEPSVKKLYRNKRHERCPLVKIGGDFMLIGDKRIKTLVGLLDARTRIVIWSSNGAKKIFEGQVYKLYDDNVLCKKEIKDMRIQESAVIVSLEE